MVFEITPNKKGTYALVDESGNIIEKFRVIGTAIFMKPKYEKMYFKKLKVVTLK